MTRISLGVQSLRDEELASLARGHSAGEARGTFAAARCSRVRGRQHRSHLRHRRPDARRLARWARAGDRARAGPCQLLCPPAGAGARRVGSARRGPARCAGATGWRDRQDDELAAEQYGLAEELLAVRGLRPLRAELVGAARAREPAQRGLLGSPPLHRNRRGSALVRRRAPSVRGTMRELDAYLAALAAGERPIAGQESCSTRRLARSRHWRSGCGDRRVRRPRAYRDEFGEDPLERDPGAVEQVVADGLLEVDADTIRLSDRRAGSSPARSSWHSSPRWPPGVDTAFRGAVPCRYHVLAL